MALNAHCTVCPPVIVSLQVVYIWALGLLAAGQSSTMTGESAAGCEMWGSMSQTWWTTAAPCLHCQ